MFNNSSNDNLETLLIQVTHLHFKRMRTLLNKIGLYKGQPRLLSLLWDNDGRTQKELAERMHIEPATITKMVSRMEAAGFIIKKADQEDMRISRIHLTQLGKEIKKEVDKIHETLFEEAFNGLTTEEKIILRRLLIHIKDNLLTSLDTQI